MRTYIRSLATAALVLAGAGTAAAQQQDSAALVARGKAIFEGKQGGALCVTCHGPQAKGVVGLGPDLTDGKWLHGDGGTAFLEAVIKSGIAKPKAGVLTMPPMGGASLDAVQLKALAAYIRSLGAKR